FFSRRGHDSPLRSGPVFERIVVIMELVRRRVAASRGVAWNDAACGWWPSSSHHWQRTRAATRLGAPVIRVFAGPQQKNPKDWQTAAKNAKREDVEGWMAEALHTCAEHGEKFGVLVAVQNHGDFISTGPEHLSLLQRVDHSWCGALVDTGKYFSDDPYADIAMMTPYAMNWQIKETLGSRLKSPPTDFQRLTKIIHDGGYRGFVPIETLAMGRKDYDPAAEVVKVLAAMREAISSLQ
ncbi:MAG: TIM barrel protein, partial [Prosthecobacter sp.]